MVVQRNIETRSCSHRCSGKAITITYSGARGGVVVKALRYKPAGRGFDSRWCH
jgi:hypothetical protein